MRKVCRRLEEKGLRHSDSGLKKKRGDFSPLPLSHESTAVCQAFSRFTGASRPREALARSLRLFALRCSPSFGLARRRNANTGMNLAGANRECCSLSRPAETSCSPGSRVTRQALARRAAQDQIVLDRLDNTFVTLERFWVNGTQKSFRCGKLGNVEIVRSEAARCFLCEFRFSGLSITYCSHPQHGN